jgi:hypothetical protein
MHFAHFGSGFLAPEVASLQHQSAAADMWAAGILFANLVVDHVPYFQEGRNSLGRRDLYSAIGFTSRLQEETQHCGCDVLCSLEA